MTSCFFMNQFAQFFFLFCFHWMLFSRKFWIELKRRPLSIRQGSIFFNKIEHLCIHVPLVCWYPYCQNQLLNGRVYFNVEEKIGSIIVPLKEAPMLIDINQY